ncbi:AlpA family phage regulatory protein [Amycolatopsis sp. lyj-84]|uniref:AlpA family phage regulatory protein n=1 Tax=Amycolatopsis sp. lyj-84 TaxID=2789284 RepID=UPI00397AC977
MPSNTGHDKTRPPTLAEVRRWPASVGVPTAATAFGISRSQAYALIKHEEFPAKVLRVGHRLRVVTASIIQVLSEGAEL